MTREPSEAAIEAFGETFGGRCVIDGPQCSLALHEEYADEQWYLTTEEIKNALRAAYAVDFALTKKET